MSRPIKTVVISKSKWHALVKKEMKKAAVAEAVAKAGHNQPIYLYRWEHVKSVVRLAKKIAREVGADEEIVTAAGWLHDITKLEAGDDHPIESAKFARAFLKKTDFPAQKIEAVAQAIEDHMGLWRDKPLTDLESAVLWDADKLTKIGLTAAFHWLGGAMARDNASMTTKEMIKFGRSADWQAKTVASMHTAPAKRAAASRLQAYRALWDRLEMELKGQDLG